MGGFGWFFERRQHERGQLPGEHPDQGGASHRHTSTGQSDARICSKRPGKSRSAFDEGHLDMYFSLKLNLVSLNFQSKIFKIELICAIR